MNFFKLSIIVIVIFSFAACRKHETVNPHCGQKDTSTVKYTFITYKSNDSKPGCTGWGYDILMNGKVYIHQPIIPAVSGNFGFETEEEAEKTASTLITKIKAGNASYTVKELNSMLVGTADTLKVDEGVILFRSQYDSYCGCKGWGYYLTDSDGPYQYQPHIPGVSGFHSFRCKEDALKCARLSQKYKSVTLEEMQDEGLLDCE